MTSEFVGKIFLSALCAGFIAPGIWISKTTFDERPNLLAKAKEYETTESCQKPSEELNVCMLIREAPIEEKHYRRGYKNTRIIGILAVFFNRNKAESDEMTFPIHHDDPLWTNKS